MEGIAERKFKRKIAVSAAIVCILSVAALTFLFDADQFRPQIEARLSAELGRDVRLGGIRLSIFSGSLSVDDISIMDNPEFSESPFVSARSLYIGVKLKPLLFSKKIYITKISLEHPSIYLRRSTAGKWNVSDLGVGNGGESKASVEKTETILDIKVERLRITDGRVEIIEAGKKPSAYEKVSLSVHDLSRATESHFTLTVATGGDGLFALDGSFGPLNQEDTLLTAFMAAFKITHFDPGASGYIPDDAGFSGLFDFSGDLSSDGSAVQSKGSASISKLRLVNNGTRVGKPVSLNYDLRYDLKNKTGTLSDATVGFGQAAMRLYGDFDSSGDAADLKVTLKGNGVPIDELQEFLPAFGVVLPKGAALSGGILEMEITTEGSLNNLTFDGSVEITGTTLAGFNLGDKMTFITDAFGLNSSPDTQIEKLYASLSRAADGITVKNIQLVIPSLGEISGEGTISPLKELDFTMRATVSHGALTSLTKGKAFEAGFSIHGDTANPEFVPDYKDAARILIDALLSGKDSGSSKPADHIMDSLKGLLERKVN